MCSLIEKLFLQYVFILNQICTHACSDTRLLPLSTLFFLWSPCWLRECKYSRFLELWVFCLLGLVPAGCLGECCLTVTVSALLLLPSLFSRVRNLGLLSLLSDWLANVCVLFAHFMFVFLYHSEWQDATVEYLWLPIYIMVALKKRTEYRKNKRSVV